MFRHTKTTIIVWLAVVILAAGATSFPALWSLDTELVRQGEWWRLISGHLVHLSWQHYGYDLLALGLVLCLCHRMTSVWKEIVWVALCSSVAVSMSIQVLHPVDVYGGLSGVAAGLLAWSTLMLIRHGSQLVGSIVLVGMIIKLYLEWKGMSVSGVAVVWQAHCAGALAGALYGVREIHPLQCIRRYQKMRSTP
jgi:rhomboid family GlyGly-CTERM serine protease